MSRALKLATVQMDAAPAPLADRLARADALVTEAAAQGAQLVVLPELFNAGYEYHDRNYALAETLNGPTLEWMKATAARYWIHLAGSFLLRDGDEVFNSAFIVAPEGRTWRYDKIYPYAWERAYFREGRHITIAETDLGRFGMLICWDTAHADLWRRYAGQVDAMVITSCPPAMQAAEYILPNGKRIHSSELGIPNSEAIHFQHQDIETQARWMGVPVVASTGAGAFRSDLPMPVPAALAEAVRMRIEAGYGHYAKIIRADGTVAACVDQDGDGVQVAEITLPDDAPHPAAASQPAMRIPDRLRLLIDVGSAAMIPLYRAGVRRTWGARMAPVDPRTWVWAGVTAVALMLGLWWGKRR